MNAASSSSSTSCPPYPEASARNLSKPGNERRIARLVAKRGRGEPLQYVLGSQPFGRLDLKCKKGVLIPRPETEAYVFHLAGLIRGGAFRGLGQKDGLKVLDLCTGTGCIALLLYEQLHRHFPGVRVTGLDVSPVAVGLARDNLRSNARRGFLPDQQLGGAKVTFEQADVFGDDWVLQHFPEGTVDVLISNPPYISTKGFNQDTGRSVRNFEPRLALVPDEKLEAVAIALHCELEDVFYARIFEIARLLKPKVVLLEVGDMEQAKRVAQMATRMGSPDELECSIWRDEPSAEESETCALEGMFASVQGEGHGRSVLVYRKPNKGTSQVE